MQYAHNENWLLTGEDDGKLKYWKPNLECVKVLPDLPVAHCQKQHAVHTASIADSQQLAHMHSR